MMNQRVIYWIVIIVAISPIILLLPAWWKKLAAASGRDSLVLLTVATISYAWLNLGMWWPAFWGSSTRVRLLIIDTNFAVMLICMVFAFRARRGNNIFLQIACVFIFALWAFQGALNSIV